jgi:RNA polymerase sigma-70 factor (ECF subfamily)
MITKSYSIEESNYRVYYGKLFSALINQFGMNYVSEIEDAIQNSFLKSIKSWKPNLIPDNRENWLYIVARNDLINQIKKNNKVVSDSIFIVADDNEIKHNDTRLQTIMFLSSSKKISTRAKVILILKNIFGLSIKEISDSTLLNKETIYKSINRAKKKLQLEFENQQIDLILKEVNHDEISIVEEILYAVFNIGFDSFNEKIKSIVNEDLCLEALSIAKLLFKKYQKDSTRNILALFCFHIARISAKVSNGKLIPFFEQDKSKWNKKLIELGFYYLHKPKKLDKFYIETLIVSKYITTTSYNIKHWVEIINLYELLIKLSNSPIIKLNLCYSLFRAQRTTEALKLIDKIKNELPNEHIYYSIMKAKIIKETNPQESDRIMSTVLNKMNHTIRKKYLLERGFINVQ